MCLLTVKAVVCLDEAQRPHRGAKVWEETSVQQPARWKSAPLITRRGLGEQCPLLAGGTVLPLRLTAEQQVLEEEMASQSGRGGGWDAQDCRLRGYGHIAAGNFNTYKNCISWWWFFLLVLYARELGTMQQWTCTWQWCWEKPRETSSSCFCTCVFSTGFLNPFEHKAILILTWILFCGVMFFQKRFGVLIHLWPRKHRNYIAVVAILEH